MSKMSKACDISPKVRKEITERDKERCIVCGSNYGLQVAHYISRAKGGLGNAQNLALMCVKCHSDFDNGKFHKEIKNIFKGHLKAHYKDWDEKALIYSKWKDC